MNYLPQFGRRKCVRPRRYNVAGSPCNKLKRSTCKSTSRCSYVKRRGCRRKGSRGLMRMSDLMAAARVPDVIAANGFGYRRMRLSAFGKKIKSHYPGYSLKDYKARMMAAFGKKQRTRKGCGVHRRRIDCAATVGCTFKKGRGCIKKRKKVARASKSVSMSGDEDLGSYADEAGISFFGRRRPFKFRKSKKSRKTVRRTRRKVRKTLRKVKKLPAKIRKMCKKLKIKCTKKVGSRRVYKKLAVIKKQIARKMRSMRKRSSRSRR